MTRRGQMDLATARRLLSAITLSTYGDRVVVAWLRLFGAQAGYQGQGKAA